MKKSLWLLLVLVIQGLPSTTIVGRERKKSIERSYKRHYTKTKDSHRKSENKRRTNRKSENTKKTKLSSYIKKNTIPLVIGGILFFVTLFVGLFVIYRADKSETHIEISDESKTHTTSSDESETHIEISDESKTHIEISNKSKTYKRKNHIKSFDDFSIKIDTKNLFKKNPKDTKDPLENEESVYPDFPLERKKYYTNYKAWEEAKRDFEFRQFFVKNFISKIPSFENEQKGAIKEIISQIISFKNGQKAKEDAIKKVISQRLHSEIRQKGKIEKTIWGKARYSIEYNPENQGASGSVIFVTITYNFKGKEERKIAFAVKIPSLNNTMDLQEQEINALTLGNGSPHIITFYGAFKIEQKNRQKNWAIVMEKAVKTAGSTAKFREKRGFKGFLTLENCCQILKALEFLHLRGLAYHDPKHANILIDKDGNARLADLGSTNKNHFGERYRQSFTPLFGSQEYMNGGEQILKIEVLNAFFQENNKMKKEIEKILGGELSFLTFLDVQKINKILEKPEANPTVKYLLEWYKIFYSNKKFMNFIFKNKYLKNHRRTIMKINTIKGMDLFRDKLTKEEKEKYLTLFVKDPRAHDINGFGFVFIDQLTIGKNSHEQIKIITTKAKKEMKTVFDLKRLFYEKILDEVKIPSLLKKLLVDMISKRPPPIGEVVRRLEEINEIFYYSLRRREEILGDFRNKKKDNC